MMRYFCTTAWENQNPCTRFLVGSGTKTVKPDFYVTVKIEKIGKEEKIMIILFGNGIFMMNLDRDIKKFASTCC